MVQFKAYLHYLRRLNDSDYDNTGIASPCVPIVWHIEGPNLIDVETNFLYMHENDIWTSVSLMNARECKRLFDYYRLAWSVLARTPRGAVFYSVHDLSGAAWNTELQHWMEALFQVRPALKPERFSSA